jgi:hypothetical protein
MQKENLNEISTETILMGLGFIPVIGEVFDTILIIKYFKEKRWIEGCLMILSLIPTVGDVIAKPFLFMARKFGAFKSASKFTEFVATNPKAAELYKKMGSVLTSPKVEKYISQVGKKYPDIAKNMKAAQSFHLSEISKIGQKGIGRSVKKTFQNKSLEKFIARTGHSPSNWLSNWWNVVYKGKIARNVAMKKAILSSNVLGALGVPNFESLEQFLSTNEGANKAMNTPEFVNMYNQTTTSQDENLIQQQSGKDNGGGGFLSNLGGLGTTALVGGGIALSIPMLKKIASVVIRN